MTHILLVTDDADLSNMLMVYLHHQGYEITHVTDYTSALDMVQDVSVQMVIFGVIENSDISNFEFAKQVNKLNSKLGMIGFDDWSYGIYREIEVSQRYDNAIFICIPFDIEELHLLIKDELKRPR